MAKKKDYAASERLYVVQQTLGLTLKEMANIMEYSNKGQYLKVRNGETRITADRLRRMHDEYQVNLNYLVAGDDRYGVILVTDPEGIVSPNKYDNESLENYMTYLHNWFINEEDSVRLKRAGIVTMHFSKLFGKIK